MSTVAGALAGIDSLEQLKEELVPLAMMAGWNKREPSLWAAPRSAFRPMTWSWANARAGLDVAGRLISAEQADRRNLFLVNPIEGNYYATLRTLVSAYQMILPGERARSHRHSPNALRLVLAGGESVYTVVDGVRIDMKPGDVVLTPGWSWHGHGNDGAEPGYWIDFLDVPLVHLLEPMFFEPWPEGFQEPIATTRESDFVFPLERTLEALAQAADDEFGRTRITLEAPSMATVTLQMERLDPRVPAPVLRTTANQILAVVSGNGATVIDGVAHPWQAGDVIAIPSWRPYAHRSDEAAVLFTVSDEKMLRALALWRQEAGPATTR